MENGNSTEAIVNTDFSINVQKERTIEIMGSLLKSISEGNVDSIKPMVIAVKDGNLIVENCKVDDEGNISLPEIKVNSKKDIAKKSKYVRRIVKEITPVLHAEIENVSFIALMRKDTDKLDEILSELQKGTKPRLENRVGCIWLIVGDYEFVL